MNLKDPNCNMRCFPQFVDVIFNKCKQFEASLGHPEIRSGNHYGCFSKGRKHIPFHSLVYHHLNDFNGELSFARKHNLMEDKPLQADVFNKAQWTIVFYYM
jgi:hypothetical protein